MLLCGSRGKAHEAVAKLEVNYGFQEARILDASKLVSLYQEGSNAHGQIRSVGTQPPAQSLISPGMEMRKHFSFPRKMGLGATKKAFSFSPRAGL